MYNLCYALYALRVTRGASCLTKRFVFVNRIRHGPVRSGVCAIGVYWFYSVKVLLLRARILRVRRNGALFAEVQMYRHVLARVTWRSSSRSGSPRQPEVVRLRRYGETVVAVQVRFAVLGRDLHVEVMHDVDEEQEQR